MKNINTFEKYHSNYKISKIYEGEELCKCGNIATHVSGRGLEDADVETNDPMCNDCYNKWWIKNYISEAKPIEFDVTPIKGKKIIKKKKH